MAIDYSNLSVSFGVNNMAPANATIEYYTEPPKQSFRRRNLVALVLILLMLLSSVCICVYCRFFHTFSQISQSERQADAIAYSEPLNSHPVVPVKSV